MLAIFLLSLAVVAVLVFGVGLSFTSMLIVAAAIVIVWSAGAFVPTRRERRRYWT